MCPDYWQLDQIYAMTLSMHVLNLNLAALYILKGKKTQGRVFSSYFNHFLRCLL